jgi:hypothetical protein
VSAHWTEQQSRFFDTFGFIKFPDLFTDEIDGITEDFEYATAKLGGRIMPFADQTERLSRLIDDPRVHDVAAAVLGDDFNYMGCNGAPASGDTPWHHDGREKLRFLRFFFYLDPLGAESGALRVIPGSHKLGDAFADSLVHAITGKGDLSAEDSYQARETDDHPLKRHRELTEEERKAAIKEATEKHRDEFLEVYGVNGEDIPAAALTSRPGDVILFDHRIMHAAYGGGDRRRFFTINLSERADERLIGDMRGWVTWHLRASYPDPLVTGAMVEDAGPERMRHLEQVLEHQPELQERVRAEFAAAA